MNCLDYLNTFLDFTNNFIPQLTSMAEIICKCSLFLTFWMFVVNSYLLKILILLEKNSIIFYLFLRIFYEFEF